MSYDYFYEEQSEQFLFYRIPKTLMTEKVFAGLSGDAKILYGLCLDRVSLSRKNHWVDSSGRVFIYYTLNGIMKDIGCAVQKAVKLLRELESYGLIERVRQGQGRPSRIYVKNFIPPLRKSKNKNFESHCSETLKAEDQELRKAEGSNTEKNNTEQSDTNRIKSDRSCCDGMRESYREYLEEHLAIEDLKKQYPYDKENLEGIKELILDILCSDKATIRVQGEVMPTVSVKSRLMMLRSDHIEYVMDCMKQTSTEIRNIRQYLIAALYNAPCTIDSYYSQAVRHDFSYFGREREEPDE